MQTDRVHVVVERSRVKALAIIAQGSGLTLIVGALGVLTFAGFGAAWILTLLRAGPGLVVDDTGFDDHSSGVAVGRVPWADVTSMSEWSAFGRSSVVVTVRDPEVYLARLGRLARLAATANRRLVGSPVTVASSGLKTSFASLSTLLREGFEQYHLRRPET